MRGKAAAKSRLSPFVCSENTSLPRLKCGSETKWQILGEWAALSEVSLCERRERTACDRTVGRIGGEHLLYC